jgi:ferredoxin-NADP reductase
MQVELIKKIKETKDSFSFVFKPEKEVTWEPGQFIFYQIPHRQPDSRGIKRHFTISSAPYEKFIMLTSRFDFKNGSSFKKALFNLKPGDRIEAFDIKGNFVVSDINKKFVFIAGGIGITPYRSILLDFINRSASPDVAMLYGNKSSDIIFKDILDNIGSSNGWLDINYIIEPQLIDSDLIKRSVNDIYNSIYYMSGPPGMVKAIRDTLLGMKIEKENMVTDYFSGYDD